LGPIVGILCIGRVIAWIAHLVVCMRQYEYLRRGMRIRFRVLGPLVRTGGWMTVSNIVSPAMSYLDRFFIGAILPLAAVAHYVTPYEVVMKLLVFPAALVGAFFPAFAATFVTNRIRTAALFEQSIRAVVLLMFPPLLVIVLFAHEGLTAWVGPAFAHESATVLQWLTVGVFVNALAQAPFTVLQGIGRPDLTARLHLAEGPVYVVALWILAHRYGIVGVAAAWTLRAAIDLAALLVLTMRMVPDPDRRLDRTLLFSASALGVLGLAAAVQGVPFKALYGAIVLAGFGILGWTRLVNPAERALIATWTRRLLARPVPQT
jgi:O-antigen/teichoic acid export membrane protein